MNIILWQFLALLLSGWLYVDAAYRGPRWQHILFKPITMLLLLIIAWELLPEASPYGYLILFALLASLVADLLQLFTKDRFLYVLAAFFVSHLLYTIAFASQFSFSFFWPLPLVLLIVGAAIFALIGGKLENLRWPVALYLATSLLMTWGAGERYFDQGNAFSFTIFAGATLLLLADIIWLISAYRFPFKASKAIYSCCYFIGHFLIVRSLLLY